MFLEEKEVLREVEGVEYKYIYKLMESEYNNTKVYGIEVVKGNFNNGKLLTTESDSVRLISPKLDKVRSMLETLYNGIVSPIHLIDIIGEQVDKCVIDFN